MIDPAVALTGRRRQSVTRPSSLADAVPTHTTGDLRLSSGRWLSLLDMAAWHEAGHAVAHLHDGWRVHAVTLGNPYRRERGWCDTDKGVQAMTRFGDDVSGVTAYNQSIGVSAVAGAVAVYEVRTGLGMTFVTQGEKLSRQDLENLICGAEQAPMYTLAWFAACETRARDILLQRRQSFSVFVRALLRQRTLDESEVLALWRRHA